MPAGFDAGEDDQHRTVMARAAGWTDQRVLEITTLVAPQTMTSYVNKLAETGIDWPAAS
ncbi:hypothetical protein ACTMTI_51365 [Nonomuraea sp. H19]|uniref:hypothetical protein n=1 Tax=Nonomuraea sp. H19 TaxID=3452206 RepID=UPI003F8C7F4B